MRSRVIAVSFFAMLGIAIGQNIPQGAQTQGQGNSQSNQQGQRATPQSGHSTQSGNSGPALPGTKGARRGQADRVQPVDPASTQGLKLSLQLVRPEQKVRERSATVQASVDGLKMTDPDLANGVPKPGEGHLHYVLDNAVVIASTATKMSFHELTSGVHKISVRLVGNDHSPLGAEKTVEVTIP